MSRKYIRWSWNRGFRSTTVPFAEDPLSEARSEPARNLSKRVKTTPREETDMSTGEILFMVAVVAVAILVTALKSKVPAWLGFILMLVASAVAIVGGAATQNYKAIPLG